MLGSTREQTSEDCTLSLNSISIATVHPISLSGKGKRKQGEIKWLWGPRMKIREWESENEKQINLAPEGDPEQSSQRCTGGRLGSSKPCNDNIRTFFPMLLWCLKIALELERNKTGQILGDWGTSLPASKQRLLLTIPQKDWHGMTIPPETQTRHLGAKFVIVPSGESRAFSERQGASIPSVQHGSLLRFHRFSPLSVSHLRRSHPAPSAPWDVLS